PQTTAALAAASGCDPAVLLPVLRLVAGLGFFDSPEPDTWALTARGRVLLADQLGPLAAFVGAPDQWDPWSRLRDAAKGGDVAFMRAHRRGLYDLLAADPAAAARYDAAIDSFTRHEADALCRAFDFAGCRQVIDVGGGHGTLLLEVMRRWPSLRGVLFDLPHVVQRARPRLARELGDRVAVAGGDFFAGIPRGADALLLKHVLHNWDDERALALLRQCRAALPAAGALLVIETLLAPDNRADLAAMLDLEMMVLLGGRERRKPELRRLLATAELVLDSVAPLVSGSWLLVARRRS
ncbi:MAG: methyltransferase, partial [Planctomycetota bacterium]